MGCLPQRRSIPRRRARRPRSQEAEIVPRQGLIYTGLFTFPLSLTLSHQGRGDEEETARMVFNLLPSPWSLSLSKGEG